MAEFDTDFLVPNGTENNGDTHYDKVNFTSKANLMGMTGYTKPAEPSPVTASDTALAAIGKIERQVDYISLENPTVSIDNDSLRISGPQGSTGTLTVTTNSDGVINATSADTSIATVSVSGSVVTITSVGEGTTTITIQQASSSTYKASQAFVVSVETEYLVVLSTLNDNSWDVISQVAQAGDGDLYWDVGDCKEITLNGSIGSQLTLSNQKLCVFILGFNHPVNGNNDNNIIFGGFKSSVSGGTDVALCDSKYGTEPTTGTIVFNMNHSWTTSSGNGYYGTNYGGWKGTDFRYDILGATSTAPSQYNQLKSTSNVGYDATTATLTNPKANTLLAALPSDFRSALRLWTRWVDNTGNKSNIDANVTACVDAGISLLTEYEIFSARNYANQYEQNHNSQMAYYAAGNSTIKKKHSDTSTAVYWWECSPRYTDATNFCSVHTNGSANRANAHGAYGLSPAFKV